LLVGNLDLSRKLLALKFALAALAAGAAIVRRELRR